MIDYKYLSPAGVRRRSRRVALDVMATLAWCLIAIGLLACLGGSDVMEFLTPAQQAEVVSRW